MKILVAALVLIILAIPAPGICFHVQGAENCGKFRLDSRQINGVIGGVIMGERPFLTLVMENGDELIMFPENDEALSFFRENEGKKMRVSYHQGEILLTDDFSGDGPGECPDAYYFESGKLIE